MSNNIVNQDFTNNNKPKSNLKGYFLVWGGQSVSLLGSQIVAFAIIWWLTFTTNSEIVLSVAMFFELVPLVIFSPIAGVVADRFSRKKIMIITDSMQALVTLALIYLFFAGIANFYYVLIILGFRATLQAFQAPAIFAIVPSMVPQKHIGRINAIQQFVNGIILVLSPAIGALLIEVVGVNNIAEILWIDVLTFVFALITIAFVFIPLMKRETIDSTDKSSFTDDFREGISYIRASGLLPVFALFMVYNILFNPIVALLPLFVKDIHLGGATEYSIFIALFALGSLTGSILMTITNITPKIMSILLISTISVIGLFLVALAPQGSFFIMYMGMALVGISVGLIDILFISLLQIVVPLELQGRVASSVIMIIKSVSPLAVVFVGFFTEITGSLTLFYILSPSIMVIVLIYGVFISRTRKLDQKFNFNLAKS
ncbi:MAG: MFS transporter [Candidatus Hodarchaeales archaeon]|jgi:DHA3 family macrolide efflux protein-like MFS transporter